MTKSKIIELVLSAASALIAAAKSFNTSKPTIQKEQTMSKITIACNSYVITSAVSMADMVTVKKYRPSALATTDPETKETLFKVGIGYGFSWDTYG